MLDREQPRVLVHDDEFAAIVRRRDARRGRSQRRRAEREPARSASCATGDPRPPLDPAAEEGRTVILTSGTTGAPKGARVARAPDLEPLAWFLSVVPIDAGSICLIPAPLFHAHGLGQFIDRVGARAARSCCRARFDAEETLALIERHRIEVLAVVPTMLKRIMDLDPGDARAATTRARCASWCAAARRSTPGWRARSWTSSAPVLYNLYGSTEVAWATIATPRRPAARRPAPSAGRRPTPASRSSTTTAARCRPARPATSSWRTRCCSRATRTRRQSRARVDGMMTPGDLGPPRRAGAAVHRLARGRHDHLGRRERVPGPGRGGAARRIPTSTTRS